MFRHINPNNETMQNHHQIWYCSSYPSIQVNETTFNTRQTWNATIIHRRSSSPVSTGRNDPPIPDCSPEDRVTHIILHATKFTIAPNFEIEGTVNVRTRGPLETYLFRDRCQHDRQIWWSEPGVPVPEPGKTDKLEWRSALYRHFG